MIDGTFIETLKDSLAEPQVVEVDGIKRMALPTGGGNWKLDDTLPKAPATPGVLKLGTLQGLVSYLNANRDGLKREELTVQVVNPRQVDVRERMTEGDFRRRQLVAQVELDLFAPDAFKFGVFQELEPFIIGLQASFADTADKAAILKLIGNVKDEAVKVSVDDGVTQTVTARQGAVLGQNVEVPTTHELAPYRTFREVEQPVGKYLLRLRTGGPTVALFEADGGAWKLEAIERVRVYLVDKLVVTGLPAVSVIA